MGSHEETIAAMNATLTYSYTLTLSYGAEYTFVSEYTVMGQPQTYTQTGTFTVDGEKLSLTAKGESTAETGTITADKTITTKMLGFRPGQGEEGCHPEARHHRRLCRHLCRAENHEHGDVHDGGREPGAG